MRWRGPAEQLEICHEPDALVISARPQFKTRNLLVGGLVDLGIIFICWQAHNKILLGYSCALASLPSSQHFAGRPQNCGLRTKIFG